ncbi:MAG: thioredoxin family protein [Treponema sp.]|nr:thioredoxin family protein [Treponema sp.]
MIRLPFRAFLPLLSAVLLLSLASCKKKLVWQTDFDTALKEAGESGRSVLVLFSGEDWDGKTQVFRSDVLDTDEFKDFARERYVLLNIDLSEAEQARAIEEGDGDLLAGIEARSGLLRRYGVSSYPTLALLSGEGYVLTIVQYDEGLNSPAVLEEILEEQAERIQAVSSAIALVRSSSGAEKVRAIDRLYEATPETGRKPLDSLVREVPSLDPSDASGLVGKYEFIRVYEDAIEKTSEGVRDGVAESFVEIAENGHLSPAQKFEAFYNAAYLMALFGDKDFDRMYWLLGKAQEADPENIRMEDITDLMAMIAQMRDIISGDN